MANLSVIQNWLTQEWERARVKNPSYSQRAFAKRLGVSSSALSEILRGKRHISPRMLSQMAERIGVDPSAIQKIKAQYLEVEPTPQGSPLAKHQELTFEHFRVISDWWHFAILSLLETKGADSSPEWIGQRLGIPTLEAKRAVERLQALGLLEVTSRGKLKATGLKYRTPTDIKNASLQKSHSKNLEIAQQALLDVPVPQREFGAVTMAVDPDKMPDAKKLIQKFLVDLSTLMESGTKREVYKMCVQLFPLTKLENENENVK